MKHSYLFELKGFVTVSVRAPSRKIANEFVASLDNLPVFLDEIERESASIEAITFYADDVGGPLLLEENGWDAD